MDGTLIAAPPHTPQRFYHLCGGVTAFEILQERSISRLTRKVLLELLLSDSRYLSAELSSCGDLLGAVIAAHSFEHSC